MNDYKDISERLARLEEKVNFMINSINKQTA
jgi:tetrahydromethanopterin S-methyltransferase subunit G